MMFRTESISSIIYTMRNVICNETDYDTKLIATFARNFIFERENPKLLNQIE